MGFLSTRKFPLFPQFPFPCMGNERKIVSKAAQKLKYKCIHSFIQKKKYPLSIFYALSQALRASCMSSGQKIQRGGQGSVSATIVCPAPGNNTLSTFAKRREKEGRGSILLRRTHTRASLLAQWQRLQETWVQSLIQEDPTCHGATWPVYRNY